MDFLQLCADRYSVRSFADTPIPDEVLNQILEAGRLAPTAMNFQPQRVFVIRSEDGKLVSTSAHTRSWDDMWDNGYCTETVSSLPADTGSYTLSIYIENGLLAELPFTIK